MVGDELTWPAAPAPASAPSGPQVDRALGEAVQAVQGGG